MAFTVSTVIPAYNAEKHIGRAVDSVLNQSRPADEIIIVDDGSTDRTAEVIKSYGDKVRYIYQENGGASVARNTGIKAAKGNWIAFLDCDDEWLAEYLQRQAGLVDRNPEIAWMAANFYNCLCSKGHKKQIHDRGAGGKLLNRSEVYEDYFQAYIKGASGWTGTLIIRKDVLNEAGLFTPKQLMANDVDMWWRIAYIEPRMGYNKKPLAVYHSEIDNSITKKYRSPDLLCNLIERHLEISESNGAYDRFKSCAEHMIKYWTYIYMFDDRFASVAGILKRFSNILKPHYKIIIRTLMICPTITLACKPLIDKISWRLQIRK